MIGSQFNGSVELINYFAQDANDNQHGVWHSMEMEWANQITTNGAGSVTNIVIIPEFDPGVKRPKSFTVSYNYGGNPQPSRQPSNF